MFKNIESGWLYRVVATLIGMTMVTMGVAPMYGRGDLFYTNWFNGIVFAPLAILFGIVVLFSAIFKPQWLAARRINRLPTPYPEWQNSHAFSGRMISGWRFDLNQGASK